MLNAYCLIKSWESQPNDLAISLAQCLDVALIQLELYNALESIEHESGNIVFRFRNAVVTIMPDGTIHYADGISQEYAEGNFEKLAEWCCRIKNADEYRANRQSH